MRMWNIVPEALCNVHLNAEHFEMHCFAGSIIQGKNIDGYIENGMVATHFIRTRHNALVEEMKRRGMNRHSPLQLFSVGAAGWVSYERTINDLSDRCRIVQSVSESCGMRKGSWHMTKQIEITLHVQPAIMQLVCECGWHKDMIFPTRLDDHLAIEDLEKHLSIMTGVRTEAAHCNIPEPMVNVLGGRV